MVTTKSVAAKLAAEPTGKNGKASKVATTTTAAPQKLAETPKIEEPKEAAKVVAISPEVQPQQVPSIQDRLKKLENLNQLLQRRQLLTDALEDVNSFVHAPNAPASIRFTDAKNNTFNVSHPVVIGDMIELAKNRLTSALAEVDALIVF